MDMARYTDEQIRNLALAAVEELDRYSTQGLPLCYPTVGDYLYDFWPNLPWCETANNTAIKYILSTPSLSRTVDQFSKRFDFDMREELLSGLEPV